MSTSHCKVASLARAFSGSMLLGSTVLFAQFAPHAVAPSAGETPQIVTLDHGGIAQSPNYQRAEGEYSFANGPANFYAFSPARVGEPAPLESVTLRFVEPTTITRVESTNADFAVEDGGSCVAGRSYDKGDSCIVLVRFTPQGPGLRLGRLNVSHTASGEPASIGLGGNGYAPAISFIPSRIYTIASTYSAPNGVLKSTLSLTDAGDILYIPDPGNTLIREIDGSGTMTNLAPLFTTPISVAVDSFGFIWALSAAGSTYYFSDYYPWGQSAFGTAYKSGGACTDTTPCALSSYGMDDPGNINIDHSNNLLMEERSKGALEMPVGEVSGGTGALNLWYLSDEYAYDSGSAAAFAADIYDNLYTYYSYASTCDIVQEPLYGAENGDPVFTRVAGASKCGFGGDGGQATAAEIGTSVGQIAFDAAGDLYFTDTANQRVRMINASTGIITTVIGTGANSFTLAVGYRSTALPLSNPTGLAVDSQGQIYVVTEAPAGGATQVVQQVTTDGYLVFPNTVDGVTSAAQIAIVTNVGNSDMTLTSYAFTGTNPGDFSVDPKTTSCLLTAGSTLTPGGTCQIGVLFKPAATGSRSANLVLLDNTVNNSNTILLQGTGAASAAVFSPASLTFPSTMVNQSATRSVTVTNAGTANLTVSSIAIGGTNSTLFTSTSTCGGKEIAPKATCTISVTYKPTSVGSDSAVVNLKDNAPGGQHSVPLSGSAAAPAAAAIQLTSGANPASSCAPVVFWVTVTVTGAGDLQPTGRVELKQGATTMAEGELINGAARLTVAGLPAGTSLLTASYGGDATHAASASRAFAQTIAPGGSCLLATPAAGPRGSTL